MTIEIGGLKGTLFVDWRCCHHQQCATWEDFIEHRRKAGVTDNGNLCKSLKSGKSIAPFGGSGPPALGLERNGMGKVDVYLIDNKFIRSPTEYVWSDCTFERITSLRSLSTQKKDARCLMERTWQQVWSIKLPKGTTFRAMFKHSHRFCKQIRKISRQLVSNSTGEPLMGLW